MKSKLTDEQVTAEIHRLTTSPEVILARRERSLRYRARRYLAELRGFEKRGRELMAMGINADNIESYICGEPTFAD